MMNDEEAFVENRSDEDDEFVKGPTTERWDPLGADADDLSPVIADGNSVGGSLSGYEADQQSSSCGMGSYYHGAPPSLTMDTSRIRSLEEEQEVLATSLMALTTHFAQVQFRLRQIVNAPIKERDQLLKNLEEFAFRGIPEAESSISTTDSQSDEVMVNLERARNCQFKLIDRLKRQLTELEKIAYESGAPVLPQSIVIEKQKLIIDELKSKINWNVNEDDLPQLSSEDIKTQVDTALGELVGPLKMKEQLVAQLKTQITDLERFIAFLQHSEQQNMNGEDGSASPIDSDKTSFSAYNSYSAKTKNIRNDHASSEAQNKRKTVDIILENGTDDDRNNSDSFGTKAHAILRKASTLLQMFALTQFGCGSATAAAAGKDNHAFQTNTLKKSARYNHWGDTRAQLEVDIQEIAALAMTLQRDREKAEQTMERSGGSSESEATISDPCETYVSDSDDDAAISSPGRKFVSSRKGGRRTSSAATVSFSLTNIELTSAVRKNLAVTLQRLIQHGLRVTTSLSGSSVVPFMGCFQNGMQQWQRDMDHSPITVPLSSSRTSLFDDYSGQMHAWQLVLEYYYIKNGDQYNEAPSQKLSQSFNLDIVGSNVTISNKESLLSAIGNIINMHKPYKRSYNSHFKAFVCAALNARKLVTWLNLIFQCSELTNTYYTKWSYVAQTGFRDALHSLDTLTKYEFDLPVDLAIRQFQNIKDIFM